MNGLTRFVLLIAALWVPLIASVAWGGAEEGAKDEGDSTAPAIAWIRPGLSLAENLAEIAKKQGKDASDFVLGFHAGYAKAVRASGKPYVLAVQVAEPVPFPGISAQQIVLVTPDGVILDRLRCEINSRYGVTTTEVLPEPASDGAQFVIRFLGHNFTGKPTLSHHWHKITFRENSYTFRRKENETPDEWNKRGLCRAKIADGKLAIVFPDLELPEFHKARAIRFGYTTRNGRKSVTIEDPKELRELLSAIVVKGGVHGYGPANVRREETVDFVMPDGTTIATAFVTPESLVGPSVWWAIYLESAKFHEMLLEQVRRATKR